MDYTFEHLNHLAEQLRATPATASASQHRAAERMLQQMQHAWARLNTQYEQLLSMEEEGIYEVTLRTPTQTITLALESPEGTSLAVDLWELVSKRMERKEAAILDQHIELAAQAKRAPSPDVAGQIRALCAPEAAPDVPQLPFVSKRRPAATTQRHAATA